MPQPQQERARALCAIGESCGTRRVAIHVSRIMGGDGIRHWCGEGTFGSSEDCMRLVEGATHHRGTPHVLYK